MARIKKGVPNNGNHSTEVMELLGNSVLMLIDCYTWLME